MPRRPADNTAITMGDDLVQGTTPGTLVEKVAGQQTVALAWESLPANAAGGQFRALYQKGSLLTPVAQPIFAGQDVWAGGAAATDTIALTGLLATDIVMATMQAKTTSEYVTVAQAAAGQINLKLNTAGANGTTIVNYVVFRPV